jgi:hypothetical protein
MTAAPTKLTGRSSPADLQWRRSNPLRMIWLVGQSRRSDHVPMTSSPGFKIKTVDICVGGNSGRHFAIQYAIDIVRGVNSKAFDNLKG